MNKKGSILTVIIFFVLVLMAVGGFFYLINYLQVSKEKSNPYDITSVTISQSFVNDLNTLYINTPQDTEFLLCLFGNSNGTNLEITSYKKAEDFIYNEEIFESSGTCSSNTIATVHNHNLNICSLSYQDVYTFGYSHHKSIGLICGEDKIVFFSADSPDNSVEVIIK